MEHFYENIAGWFDFQEVYSKAVRLALRGAHFVEIGAWMGKSTAFMAVEIANSGKNIKFDVVDHWKGSAEHASVPSVVNNTLFEEFLYHTAPVSTFIHPIRLSSVEAAKLYTPGSLDFVYIDGSHDYASVVTDLKSWLPLVRLGGTIGGHDFGCPAVGQAVHDVIREFPTIVGNSWIHEKKTVL